MATQEKNLKLAREAVLFDIIRDSDEASKQSLLDYLGDDTDLTLYAITINKSNIKIEHPHVIDPVQFPYISATTNVIDTDVSKVSFTKRGVETSATVFKFATSNVYANFSMSTLFALIDGQIANWNTEINNRLNQIVVE